MNSTFDSNFVMLTCEFCCLSWNSQSYKYYEAFIKTLKMNITVTRPHKYMPLQCFTASCAFFFCFISSRSEKCGE